jgi:hypothetical protein
MKKQYLSGLLVLVMALAVAGCKTEESENTDPKIIVITGLEGISSIQLMLSSSLDDGAVASGVGAVVSGSATIALKNPDETTEWTGTGSYWVMFGNNSGQYLYTDGKTFAELGVTSQNDDATKVPKYTINDTISTISFDKFVAVPGM